jgi:hypothetical protein
MNFVRLVILLTYTVLISCEKKNPQPLTFMQQREAILSNKKMEKIKTVFNNYKPILLQMDVLIFIS